MRTVRDAIRESELSPAAIREARAIQRAEELRRIAEANAAVLREHPHIGKLVRRGQEIFYAYLDGQYVESTNAADLIGA